MNYRDYHTYVICAYGDSPHLEACIQSLQAQTVASTIILYTSTPSTYISEMASRYQLPLKTAVGGGIGKDWNAALSFVETPYATIAHQDDLYLPDYTQAIMTAASRYPNTTILYSDYYEEKAGQQIRVNPNLQIKRLMLATLNLMPQLNFWRRRILAFGNPICCPAVTYHLSKLPQFQFSETMRTSLDWRAWYDISAYQGRFTYVPQILMAHRIHEDSETSQTIADQTRTKEDLAMYQLFWPTWIAKWLNRYYVKSQKSNG